MRCVHIYTGTCYGQNAYVPQNTKDYIRDNISKPVFICGTPKGSDWEALHKLVNPSQIWEHKKVERGERTRGFQMGVFFSFLLRWLSGVLPPSLRAGFEEACYWQVETKEACGSSERRAVSGSGTRMPSASHQPGTAHTGHICIVWTALSQWEGVEGNHSRRGLEVGAASPWGWGWRPQDRCIAQVKRTAGKNPQRWEAPTRRSAFTSARTKEHSQLIAAPVQERNGAPHGFSIHPIPDPKGWNTP